MEDKSNTMMLGVYVNEKTTYIRNSNWMEIGIMS